MVQTNTAKIATKIVDTIKNSIRVFLGKTYDVSPYDSQRSHPSMDLGVKWDLCVLFVQTTVKCQDCKFVWANCTVYCSNKFIQIEESVDGEGIELWWFQYGMHN